MKAMILAAGLGTRLAPLTETMPKPMIPINSEPLIVHQIRWLHRGGIRDISINLHHLPDQITGRLGSGGDLGVRLRYFREPTLLDTGGGIVNALDALRPDPFLVLNGDIWTNYPFKQLLGRHPAKAHLVLVPPSEGGSRDFTLPRDMQEGLVGRGEDNNLTFAGIAVLNPAIFENAPDGAFSMRDLYFEAAAKGELEGERFEGTWIDIGTPEALKRVRRLTL